MLILARLLFLLAISCNALSAAGAELLPADRPLTEVIDHYIRLKHVEAELIPAQQASDATLVRRTMLDLIGRIPTASEAQAYAGATSPAKRVELVDRLLQSPGYIRHNTREFQRLLAAENENAPNLEPYLSIAMSQRKPWNQIVADLLGASEPINDEAAKFITGRLGDRDSLTRDVSSVLCGVNVSCCQCHDHPTVAYLTQDFYFGLKAFFHRSYEFHGRLLERTYAEPLRFKTRDGTEKPTRLLLISGTEILAPLDVPSNLKSLIDEEDKTLAKLRTEFGEKKQYPPLPEFIPRKLLAAKLLEPPENIWLARSLVNRLWHRFFGHGLVMRVDQMHPENPASHPELLEWLARDFIDHQYDVHRLIRGIVLSQVYSMSSVWNSAQSPPPESFAVAQVRPLTPMQYGLSLLVASHAQELAVDLNPEQFDLQLFKLEEDARKHFVPLIQDPVDGLQIGVNEALRLSNDPELLKWLGEGTVDALLSTANQNEQLRLLFWTVLSRSPDDEEQQAIRSYLLEHAAYQSPGAIEKTTRIAAACQRIPRLELQIAEAEKLARQDGLQTLFAHTAEMLSIAAQQHLSQDEAFAVERLKTLGLNSALYQNWRHYLGLHGADDDGDARHLLRNRFTTVLDEVGGNRQVVGLGSLATPSVIVNLTDQKVQWFPPQKVTVHPSRTQAVIVGWQSPIAGEISIQAQALDLDDGGGNGIAVSVRLIQSQDPTLLASEPVANGGTFQYQSAEKISIQSGDIIALTVDPLNANHGFDTTEVNLTILEAGGQERQWDLTHDVVSSILQNPHADRYGNDQVWHFALTGRPMTAVPAGSRIDDWIRTLRQPNVDQGQLWRLGAEIQALLVSEKPSDASESDLKARKHLTALSSPLFAGIDSSHFLRSEDQVRINELKAELLAARTLSQAQLSADEQAEFVRYRQTWQQIVWALLTSAEGRFNH